MIVHGIHSTPIEHAERIARDGLIEPFPFRGVSFTPPAWEGASITYALHRRQRERAIAGIEDEEEVGVAIIHADLTGLDGYAVPIGGLDPHDLLHITSGEPISPSRLHIVERRVVLRAPGFLMRAFGTKPKRPGKRPFETSVRVRAIGTHVLFTPSATIAIPQPGQSRSDAFDALRWRPARIPAEPNAGSFRASRGPVAAWPSDTGVPSLRPGIRASERPTGRAGTQRSTSSPPLSRNTAPGIDTGTV